ncbi:16426_t:CDS:1, partial [Dentiscutata heterogama]
MKNFPTPTNLQQLHEFRGLASYYHWFIKDFSKIAALLNFLLKKNTRYSWTSAQKAAFINLKERLITTPILAYSDFDELFLLFTDASGMA